MNWLFPDESVFPQGKAGNYCCNSAAKPLNLSANLRGGGGGGGMRRVTKIHRLLYFAAKDIKESETIKRWSKKLTLLTNFVCNAHICVIASA
jgi:hypothetical protein